MSRMGRPRKTDHTCNEPAYQRRKGGYFRYCLHHYQARYGRKRGVMNVASWTIAEAYLKWESHPASDFPVDTVFEGVARRVFGLRPLPDVRFYRGILGGLEVSVILNADALCTHAKTERQKQESEMP